MNASARDRLGTARAVGTLPSAVASLALATCLTALLLAPAFASAATTHVFSTSFGSAGAGAGQLSLVPTFDVVNSGSGVLAGSGLAVNDETHDVYVADTANHRIDQFSSSTVSDHTTFAPNVSVPALTYAPLTSHPSLQGGAR